MTSLYLPAQDEASVQNQLRELDSHLVLTRERDQLGRDFYVVIYYQGGSVPPELIEDWRTPDGSPRPLNSALPLEIQRRMKEGPARVAEIEARNDALRAEREADSAQAYEEALRGALGFERRTAPPPRSQALYLSRQRERERRRR